MLSQKVKRGDDLFVEADVQVAFISAGRAQPIPKPLRIAMRADQEAGELRLPDAQIGWLEPRGDIFV